MSTTFKSSLKLYLPLLLWLVFISIASTDEFSASNTSRIIGPLVLWFFPNTTSETLATIHFLTRKLAHFTEYFILGLLCARAFYGSLNRKLHQHWFVLAIMVVALYAFADEYHQSFVPSRTSSIYDSLIDIVGGLTALMIFGYFKRSTVAKRALDANS